MYVLNCQAFDDELSARYSNTCCDGDCHEKNTFISVTPYAADATLTNRSLDWTIGIQGLVCCGRYEFVRSLSREWWIRKLAVIDNWSDEQLRSKLRSGSWHKVFDKTAIKPVKSARLKAEQVCPNCGSSWNQIVCDDCGNVG